MVRLFVYWDSETMQDTGVIQLRHIQLRQTSIILKGPLAFKISWIG